MENEQRSSIFEYLKLTRISQISTAVALGMCRRHGMCPLLLSKLCQSSYMLSSLRTPGMWTLWWSLMSVLHPFLESALLYAHASLQWEDACTALVTANTIFLIYAKPFLQEHIISCKLRPRLPTPFLTRSVTIPDRGPHNVLPHLSVTA